MSLCNGSAGKRGKNPVGLFIYSDACSQNANADVYRNWLQTHNLDNGFVHYYVENDGTPQAEDDVNVICHCAQTAGWAPLLCYGYKKGVAGTHLHRP